VCGSSTRQGCWRERAGGCGHFVGRWAMVSGGTDARLGAMLDQGLARYETPELTLRLVRSSGTVAGLEARDPAAKGGRIRLLPRQSYWRRGP